jgi:hypothetical protein
VLSELGRFKYVTGTQRISTEPAYHCRIGGIYACACKLAGLNGRWEISLLEMMNVKEG